MHTEPVSCVYGPWSVLKAGLLGGEQDPLLIELHALETAGLGREEENTVI